MLKRCMDIHLLNGLVAVPGHDPVDVQTMVHDLSALRVQHEHQSCCTKETVHVQRVRYT